MVRLLAQAREFDNSVLWDVDGGGTPDFVLRRTGTVFVETGSTSYGAAQTIRSVEGYLHLDSGNNGNGVVMEYGGDPEPQDIAKLSNNVIPNVLVGPAMMGPMGSGSYVFGAPGQTGRMMMSFNSSTSSIGGQYNYGLMNANVVGAAYNGRFNQAPGSLNYFGFSFTEGGDTFYGWAAILFDLEGEDRRLEIVEWAYEDTPDTAIAVGATGVPVPAHGLAMLAAGAGSVLAMRRKRRDLALIPRTSDRDTL